jgi:formylglycine-generating enzyme required for sulfatase activity
MGQNGNAWEWSESGFDRTNDAAGESRVLRGGFWDIDSGVLSASYRDVFSPTLESFYVGFRVAAVPEPSALLLTLIGALGVVTRRKR